MTSIPAFSGSGCYTHPMTTTYAPRPFTEWHGFAVDVRTGATIRRNANGAWELHKTRPERCTR